MATVTYNCTGCVVIDRAVIDAYNILTSTEAYVSSAESDRATAEAARVLAEQERTQQFAEDHGTAQEDHRIASGDHTLAVADHGTASDDHILAVADHGTASDDHTASTSATTRANNAAAAAEHMVDIHQGPPGPSGKAPVVGANGNWFVWDDDTEAYVDSGEQAQGPEGDPGVTPDISIGTVETGAAGSEAEASMSGTVAAPVLNLKIPKGDPGVAEVCYKHVTTLPTAAAGTMNALYLVDTQTANVYDVYYTSYDGSAYSWVQLGTTTVNLSDYATKAEVAQLEQRIPETDDDGFYVTDTDLNVGMQYTEDGFDAAAVAPHFVQLLNSLGVGGQLQNYIAVTNEDGFTVVDNALNIGFIVDNDGARAKNIFRCEIIN